MNRRIRRSRAYRKLRGVLWRVQAAVADYRKTSADRRAYRKEHLITDHFSAAMEAAFRGERYDPDADVH